MVEKKVNGSERSLGNILQRSLMSIVEEPIPSFRARAHDSMDLGRKPDPGRGKGAGVDIHIYLKQCKLREGGLLPHGINGRTYFCDD